MNPQARRSVVCSAPVYARLEGRVLFTKRLTVCYCSGLGRVGGLAQRSRLLLKLCCV
jgi:hypothetical protein